jgi:hypothetical protein
MATWEEVELTWFTHLGPNTVQHGSERKERWRVDVVKEAGQWRVCELRRADS